MPSAWRLLLFAGTHATRVRFFFALFLASCCLQLFQREKDERIRGCRQMGVEAMGRHLTEEIKQVQGGLYLANGRA